MAVPPLIFNGSRGSIENRAENGQSAFFLQKVLKILKIRPAGREGREKGQRLSTAFPNSPYILIGNIGKDRRGKKEARKTDQRLSAHLKNRLCWAACPEVSQKGCLFIHFPRSLVARK